MKIVNPAGNIDVMRTKIWDYLQKEHRCLIALAEEIAIGRDPHPSHGGIAFSGLTDKACQFCADKKCPQPINYLANCASPSVYKSWPSFSFNHCDFHTLAPLAKVKGASGFIPKNIPEFCGFNTGGTQGLSILLGPWSDYCLWCWAQHPHLGKNANPILILGKDNDTFSAQAIHAGCDWGVDQVKDTAKISTAKDKSTKRLFGAIENMASALTSTKSAEEFIAENRIFVYNIWPWFRCGDKSAGSDGIHSDFRRVPCLWHWLDMLIRCLEPKKIAALGSWSYDYGLSSPDEWLRQRLPKTLNPIRFPAGAIDVFRHPSADRKSESWFDLWKLPTTTKWGGGDRWNGKKNNEAFVEFLDPSITPSNVLDRPVDE